MDEAKGLLRTCGPDVDIILARDPDQWNCPSSLESSNMSSGMGPVERRRRRKLPPIERPRSAPIHNLGMQPFLIKVMFLSNVDSLRSRLFASMPIVTQSIFLAN